MIQMQDLEPLQKMMIDNDMTEEDLAECRKVLLRISHNWEQKNLHKVDTFQVIYTLLNKETKGDMLPVPSLTIGGKTKTMKKDEQYRDDARFK